MGFMQFIKNITGSKQTNMLTYADLLNAQVPLFRMFGRDIYHSDLVQMCIDNIATECSKLEPQHVRTDSNGVTTVVNSPLNALLKYGPNEIMDTGAFIEKIVWLLMLNYNAYIYPTFNTSTVKGLTTTTCTGLYPINPTMVEFMQDDTQRMFIRFTFRNGERYAVPYDSVIHLRKKFSINEIMGGDLNGQPFNESILTTLKTDDVIVEGLEKAVQSSLALQFILKISTLANDAAQKEEREKFERALRDNKSGIMPMDLKGEIVPITKSPTIVDSTTLQHVQQRILNYYGMSLPILTGDFSDAQYEAFYQKTIQPIVMSLTRNFTRVLFSPRELQTGNQVVFYQRNLQYHSTASKIALIQTAGDQGLLTDNQKLGILGYPPQADGDRTTQSLNYMDKSVITKYQMGKANQTPPENGGGK